MKKRLRNTLRRLKGELRERLHHPVPAVGGWLRRSLQGYFNYHAVPTNSQVLAQFRTQVIRLWHASLRRRSQRSTMTWSRMKRLVNEWIPPNRVRHPWPSERLHVTIRGRSPVREICTLGSVRGVS